jgi:hypothetical protein
MAWRRFASSTPASWACVHFSLTLAEDGQAVLPPLGEWSPRVDRGLSRLVAKLGIPAHLRRPGSRAGDTQRARTEAAHPCSLRRGDRRAHHFASRAVPGPELSRAGRWNRRRSPASLRAPLRLRKRRGPVRRRDRSLPSIFPTCWGRGSRRTAIGPRRWALACTCSTAGPSRGGLQFMGSGDLVARRVDRARPRLVRAHGGNAAGARNPPAHGQRDAGPDGGEAARATRLSRPGPRLPDAALGFTVSAAAP